tara:strand:- start:3122 stop:3229 length:108 start_codon:yes stop_codon:yes gene_type:complete
MDMTLSEWLLFLAIIDGPLVGMLYLLWRKIRNEIK